MNDKMIIKAISAIYFSIVSFFVFILLVLISLFIILKNGLYLDEVSLPHLKVKQLYIKWNEKIDLSIEEIDITRNNSNNKKIDYKNFENYLNKILVTSEFFNSITITKISFNHINASFKYRKNENSFLIASSDNFKLKTKIYFQNNYLNFDIESLTNKKKNFFLNGVLYIDLKQHEVLSKLSLNIKDDLKSFIYLHLNKKSLRYKLESLQEINNLYPIINFFHLPKEVRYWILDAINMKSLTIKSAYGFVDFNHISNSLKNIYVYATINKLNYTYNPDLDAIHTQSTVLEFKQGILFIKPKEAYSYKQFLAKSSLKIDFTKKEELLSLHLIFDGVLNKNMLHILDTYKIKLPFLQKTGKVSTDLIIKVGLRNIGVDAKGTFFVKNGIFNYLGLDIDLKNLHVKLNNYDVNVNNMHASYQNIAQADVDIEYNAKKAQGSVSFKVNKIQVQKLSLLTKKKPLLITYLIKNDLDLIKVAPSQWKTLNNNQINLDAIDMPFNLNKLKLTIPTTYIELKNVASAYFAGIIDIKKMIIDLNTDLLSFNYSNIKLDQSIAELKIHYNKKLSISSKEEVIFDFEGTALKISNILLEITNKVIDIKHTKINIGNYLQANISAKYDEKKKIELIRVINLKVKNNDTLFYKKSRLILKIKNNKNNLEISSKEIDAKLNIFNDKWSLMLYSLKKISRGSKQLQQLNLTNGTLSINKFFNKKYINFTALINYPYKIFLKDKKYISHYTIKGKVNKKKIFFRLNDIANVTIKEDIKININNIGINIDEIIKFLKNISLQADSNNPKNLSLTAHNSFLDLGNNRKAISELISLQYFNSILTAQLKYKKGIAGFKLDGDYFHLYGENFNDKFMENLFTLSKFKDGSLKFSMDGTLEKYNGVFYIKNTTVLDYVVLNNILAFINTIPSLTTFSIPGYNKKGLFVKEAYMKFTSKNGQFNISDLYLGSQEISISGNGKANVNKDTININLILKTDLGSSAAKIPLVGYIVLGEDSISTGVKVTGKLSNPQVTSEIVQDIVVAPLNIIKRTLLLPYKLFKDLTTDTNSSK